MKEDCKDDCKMDAVRFVGNGFAFALYVVVAIAGGIWIGQNINVYLGFLFAVPLLSGFVAFCIWFDEYANRRRPFQKRY